MYIIYRSNAPTFKAKPGLQAEAAQHCPLLVTPGYYKLGLTTLL